MEWENAVVSDDEDQGPLIVPGEEESAASRAPTDVNLDASGLDALSLVDIRAIASRMVVQSDFIDDNEEQEGEAQDFVRPDYIEDHVEEEATSTHDGMARKKKILALVVAVVCVFLSLTCAGQAWQRRSQKIAALEQDQKIAALEQENQKLLRRDAAREQEKQELLRRLKQKGWQEEDEEEWTLADNCYVRVDLGDCVKKTVKDWNDMTTSVWDSFGAAWNAASSWASDENESDEQSKMASFSVEAFSEASHAVAHAMTAATDAVSQASNAAARGIQSAVDEVLELSRDALEDSTAYTRDIK